MATIQHYPKRGTFWQSPVTATPYDAYIDTLNPLINLKFNEASGAIVNYGSLGGTATVTGTPTYEVAGAPTGSAIRVDASPEFFTFTSNIALDLTAFSKIFTMRLHDNGILDVLGRAFQHSNETLYFAANVRAVYEVFIGGAKITAGQAANDLGGSFPTEWFTLVATVTGSTATLYAIGTTINVVDSATGTGTADAHGSNNLIIANRASPQDRNADAEFGGVVITSDVLDASDVAALRLLLYGV